MSVFGVVPTLRGNSRVVVLLIPAGRKMTVLTASNPVLSVHRPPTAPLEVLSLPQGWCRGTASRC